MKAMETEKQAHEFATPASSMNFGTADFHHLHTPPINYQQPASEPTVLRSNLSTRIPK